MEEGSFNMKKNYHPLAGAEIRINVNDSLPKRKKAVMRSDLKQMILQQTYLYLFIIYFILFNLCTAHLEDAHSV